MARVENLIGAGIFEQYIVSLSVQKPFRYKDLQNSTFGNIPRLVMCNFKRNAFPLQRQRNTVIIKNPHPSRLDEMLDVLYPSHMFLPAED